MVQRLFKIALQSLGFFLASEILRHIGISAIIGSEAATFSARHCIAPLAGVAGISTVLGVMSIGAVRTLLFSPALFWGISILQVYHIPTFCGAAYLSGHKKAMCLVAAICMAIFMLHPSSSAAWPYALYWIIPLVITFSKRQSFFWQALAATFVTHAVGSVAWLFSHSTTPAAWLALMPIVALERFCFAAGMTLVYKTYQAIAARFKRTISAWQHAQV